MSSETPRTRVVHVRHAPYDIYIGRPSFWGNPFVVGRDGARGECVARYREWIRTQPALLARLPELRGRVLGCWCRSPSNPGQVCHGDVLAELADSLPMDEELGAILESFDQG